MHPKKLSFLFIYPDIGTKSFNFSPAVQLLSSILKREKHKVDLIHVNDCHATPNNNKKIAEELKKRSFDAAGITASSFQYKRANEIAGLVKSLKPGIPVILGGTHATIKPEDIKDSNFDAFCVGEGDEALPELLEAIKKGKDYTGTKNFHFKLRDGTVIKNPIRPFMKNLDSLPYWDMDIMDMHKLLKARNRWLSISFSRGCPYKCTFCINPLLLKINITDKNLLKCYLRKRSVDNVIGEIESIARKFRNEVSVINFDDDLLMLDRKWMLEYAEKYRKRIFLPYGVRYVLNCRVNTVDDEIASKLASSGCLELRIGFETGNEKFRNSMLDKKVTNRQLIKAFRVADKYNIHTNAFTMIGIPGETPETIRDTIDMVTELKPFLIRMTFLYPYYNTDIYDYCRKINIIKDEYGVLPDSFSESPLKFKELTDADLFIYRFLFPWYVNLKLCVKFKEMISEKISKYRSMNFSRLRKASTFDKILKDDQKLSKLLTSEKLPHYRYFSNNLYYFNLSGKYGF